MTTTTKPRNGGLDWNVPRDGRASDAYQVATTCAYLELHKPDSLYMAARHATRLHVISGLLHKIEEDLCNFSYACQHCEGKGSDGSETCYACSGHGHTKGRRLESLRADAREIASHYGLSCYFQGDPRGCSLYIGEAKDMTDSTYNRGHAVTRLGR